jgi:hypothetical protein
MSRFKNKLYLIEKWLTSGNRIFYMLLLTAISSLLIQHQPFMIVGISLISFISIWLINRRRLKFDKTLHKIPEVGETIIITKEFYWNGKFLKRPEHGPGKKPWVVKIEKNKEYVVEEVLEFKDDWRFRLSDNIYLDYFETRKYWTTKSEQRDNKLKKLVI